MDQKHIVMSALGIGLGVGVGLGLVSGQASAKWAVPSGSSAGITADRVEQELMRLVVDGKEEKVTFDEFPYHLR
jgi:hypothetical protein